jgi:hypothetical protein
VGAEISSVFHILGTFTAKIFYFLFFQWFTCGKRNVV